MRRRARPAALLFLAAAAGGLGCRGDGAPKLPTVHLAALYSPPGTLLPAAEDGRSYPAVFDLAAEAWAEVHAPGAAPGLWRARAPWYASALPALPEGQAALMFGETPLRQERRASVMADVIEAGSFALLREEDGDYVYACLAPGERPEAGRVRARLSAGAPGGNGWRLSGGPFAADGFLLRPDAPAAFALELPRDARLIFDAVVVGDPAAGPVTLRVRLDGQLLAERIVEPSLSFVALPQSIELPAEGRDEAELALEIEGDTWCGLFEPRLAPVEPLPASRPDVVLFLADTFRADNLTFYGGEAGVTPVLDAFGETCVRFRRTWSPACWTLPSHASFFLGVYPPQHGAVDLKSAPGEELVSVAERLRAAGYRTAAVTDGLFVSRRFGLDRGFDRFEEYSHRDLERTFARAQALAAEYDGRPLFLFVQTYRTHEPYEVSAETRAELGAPLGIDATWDELKARVFELGAARVQAGDARATELAVEGDFTGLLEHLGLVGPDSPTGDAFLRSLRALYLGGVRDLDRAFAEFLDDLEARPRARDTWLLFTSDHGEAFNEHGQLFHGAGSFEENLRVPLFVRGPALAPRAVEHAASLVDLPQTIAEIAGVAPDPRWLGSSLLSLSEERPVFAFDCAQLGPQSGILVRDGLKVVFTPEEEAVSARSIVRAFDLAVDPGEHVDLGATPRARTALDALAKDVLRLLRALARPGQSELTATDRQNLRAMGYAGD